MHINTAVLHSFLCCSEHVVAVSGPCFLGNRDKPHAYFEPDSATQKSSRKYHTGYYQSFRLLLVIHLVQHSMPIVVGL